MRKQNDGLFGAVFFILIAISIVVGIGYGWILNIIGLLNHGSVDILGQTLLGVVGIFIVPIGAVMGYLIW